MRRTLLAFALALVFSSGFLLLVTRSHPASLEIRTQPWQMPAGKLFHGHAIGQHFVCPTNSLTEIQVALVRQPGDSGRGLRLTLKSEGPAGEVLRTSEVTPAADTNGPAFIAFPFTEVADMADKPLYFELEGLQRDQLSDWSPWISWRGITGAGKPWGDRYVASETVRDEVLAIQDDWTGVALAVDGLNVPAGRCELIVRESGQEETLRIGTVTHASPIAAGYAVFTFDPIERSRWRDYELEFVLPEGARVVESDRGLSALSLHGPAPEATVEQGKLGGLTRAGRIVPHRDLIFRTYGTPDAELVLGTLLERAGTWRIALVWLLSWIAGGLALRSFLVEREELPLDEFPH